MYDLVDGLVGDGAGGVEFDSTVVEHKIGPNGSFFRTRKNR